MRPIDEDALSNETIHLVGFSDGSLEQGFVWCQNCGGVYCKNDGRWGSELCVYCGRKLDWSEVE